MERAIVRGHPVASSRWNGGRKPGLKRTSPSHACRRSASVSIGRSRVRADVLEQPEDDLAVAALRPAADDAAVPPDGRPGVAVACRRGRRRAGRGTSRVPSSPSSSGSSVGSSAAHGSGIVVVVEVVGEHDSRSRRRGRPSRAVPPRAPRVPRGPSSPSTSGCRSRSPGPNAASHRRSSVAPGDARVERWGSRAQPRCRRHPAVLAVDPRVRGRPRTTLPSARAAEGRARRRSASPPSGSPRRGGACVARTGTLRLTISVVNASPRASSACSAAAAARVRARRRVGREPAVGDRIPRAGAAPARRSSGCTRRRRRRRARGGRPTACAACRACGRALRSS